MASSIQRYVTGLYNVVLFALFVSLYLLIFVVYMCYPTLPSFPPHVRYSSLDAPNKTYLIGSHSLHHAIFGLAWFHLRVAEAIKEHKW